MYFLLNMGIFHCYLGGGNSNIFGIFTPNVWGFMIQFDGPHIFQMGLGNQPPTSYVRLPEGTPDCFGEIPKAVNCRELMKCLENATTEMKTCRRREIGDPTQPFSI